MAYGVKAGWLIEGTGEDTGSVLFIRLPEQARAVFSAKSALRNLGCAIPRQAAVFDDCDIVFLGFGIGTKDAMQFLAHTAVAIHHVTQGAGDLNSETPYGIGDKG